MKICIVFKGEIKMRQGFRIGVFGEIRGVLVHTLAIDEKLRGKRLARALRKGVSLLRESGVTLFGAPSSVGIAGVVSEREFLLDLRARFADVFSETCGEETDFLLCGGSFRRRVSSAVYLLGKRRTIYLSCADFEESAEEISALTGATVGEHPRGKFIEVNLSGGEDILRFGEKEIFLSDFRFTFPWESAEELSPEKNMTIAAMLEICGVLRKKEIKVECFTK